VGNSFGGRIALETARGMEIRAQATAMPRRSPSSWTPRVTAPAWPEPRPLSALTMPVLVIVGERDTDDMPDAAREAPATLLMVIANASHHPSLEQPEDFHRPLLEFVA
jgi:pimeloyl-ACP methyl ester carboxylesterase